MKNIVIVYENVPESTDLYLLEVQDKDFEWMVKCHGHYVNTVSIPKAAEKACQRLSEYLAGKPKYDGKTAVSLDGYDALILTGHIL